MKHFLTIISTVLFCSAWLNAHANSINANCGSDIDFDSWYSSSPPNSTYKLIQSQTYIRHGDRTQAGEYQCFKNDTVVWNCSESFSLQPFNWKTTITDAFDFELKRLSNTEYLAGDCMVGQLTQIGYNQHIYNGQGLRQRYIEAYSLLPTVYSNDDSLDYTITLRSDDYPRTQQSAMALFTGMYETSNSGDHAFKVILETQDQDTDIILPNDNICPLLTKQKEDMVKNEKVIEHYLEVTLPLAEKLSSFMDLPFGVNPEDDFELVADAYDCMTVYSCHGKPLPQEATQELYDASNEEFSWYENEFNNFPNKTFATQNRAGPLIKLSMERFQNMIVAKGQNNDKFYVYSGHDTGPIIPMLGAFGYDLKTWTPYASLITLELFEKDSDYYVLASFNGEIIPLPSPCDSDSNEYSLCSWEKFNEYMSELTPTVEECPGLDLHGSVLQNERTKSSAQSLNFNKIIEKYNEKN